jgi:hypothetical protein
VTLKGNEAQGGADHRQLATAAGRHQTRRWSNASKPTKERQGGNDRGDAERLSAGNSSRGRSCIAGNNAMNPRIGSGMQQARRRTQRRKPSRWCETTRTEQDFEGGTLEAEATTLGSPREWTPRGHVDGGARGASSGFDPIMRTNLERRPFNRPGRRMRLRSGAG